MDGEIPNAPNVMQPEQTPKKGLLFEILFVAIVLVLVFGALNYFNILRLSEIFPNYLGFLPRKEVPTGTSQQSQQYNNLTIVPTVSLLEPAKKTLINALPNILIPSLIPSLSQTIKTQNNQIPESFTSAWTINEATATAILIVTPDGKDIDQIHLSFQKDQSTPPSKDTAPSITSAFFSVTPKGIWGCKPLGTSINSIIYCENFWEEDGTKMGIGVEGLFTQGPALVNKSPEVLIFFCQRGKTNKLYSWKSCRSEFAKTGVAP